MTQSLRCLGPLVDQLIAEIPTPWKAVEPRLLEVLEQFWPECYEVHGTTVMAKADAAQLEALFVMFGVPLQVADTPLSVLKQAFAVLSMQLSRFVVYKLKMVTDDEFDQFVADWPPEWKSYIIAVAREDMPEAQRLASVLKPLASDCAFPPGAI